MERRLHGKRDWRLRFRGIGVQGVADQGQSNRSYGEGNSRAVQGAFQPMPRLQAAHAAVEAGGERAVDQDFGEQRRREVDDVDRGEQQH